MKKILNYLFVAVIAIVSVMSVAKAETTPQPKGRFENTNGKITITAQPGQTLIDGETYKIYRILDLVSYNNTLNDGDGAAVYKTNEKWASFITGEDEGASYVTITTIDGVDYVTAISNVVEFAAKAKAYAEANSIAEEATGTVANNAVVFDELALGYYLVSSSVGTICSLDTTHNQVNIYEKNFSKPTIEKIITTTQTKESTAKIGDSVPYSITLNNLAGLTNVRVEDTLSVGLTFNGDVKIIKNSETTPLKDTDYTVTTVTQNGQEVTTIALKDEYVKTLKKGDIITIAYSATVNENSVTNEANTNDADLFYGRGTKVDGTPTETYTFGFKFYKVNQAKAALTGAEFKLFASANGDDEIPVVFVRTDEATGINYYRVATQAEIDNEEIEKVVIEAGIAVVDGLDVTTYYLKETKAPDGYNLLATRVPVTVNGRPVATTEDAEAIYEYTNTEVINTTGTILPSTGGIGTKLFVTMGSLLVAGFGVTLITNFRLKREL